MIHEDRNRKELTYRVIDHLERIYPDEDLQPLAARLIDAVCGQHELQIPEPYKANWDHNDAVLITYGDSVRRQGERPLGTLNDFLNRYIKGVLPDVHILPFFPYSSDDGFSVIHYLKVNDALGSWKHIEAIAGEFKLMSDLVINHCSSRSGWFDQFKNRQAPGKDYFIEADPKADLSEVVRPRTNPLLTEVRTSDGERHVWCTFSEDQVDLDYSNPDLLVEIAQVVGYYMDRGVKIFRLDAVAFLWKEIGTKCVHLPQTHEIIRLIRTLIGFRDGEAIIITETNVPNRENLSYFGNANEAHAIYNFSLPPLLVHALSTGNCHYLKRWMQSMPPAQPGTTYLNFIASHDGIGLRPAESLLSDEEIDELVDVMENFGGKVSYRSLSDGSKRPYEINISLIDAMSGTASGGKDAWQIQRFLCAHAIMLALEGIPAIYIHSMLGTHNDYEKLKHSGHNRSLNRHSWDYDLLRQALDNKESEHSKIYEGMCRMINIRRKQPAFHPSAVQFTMQLKDCVFGIWRQSQDRMQSIFCINNITPERQEVDLSDINLTDTDRWYGLLLGEQIEDIHGTFTLEPYQVAWLTNRKYS